MKKFMLLIPLLLLSSCGPANHQIEVEYNETLTNVVKIDFQTLSNLISNKSSFFILISNARCQHCRDEKQFLYEYISSKHYVLYDIDFIEYAQNYVSLLNYGFFEIPGTPTNFFVKDGMVIDNNIGFSTSEKLKGLFDKYLVSNNISNNKIYHRVDLTDDYGEFDIKDSYFKEDN